MSSRGFNLSQAPNNGVVVLPDVSTLPVIQQVLAVKQIIAGNVETGFVDITPGGAGGPFLPLGGGTLSGFLTLAGTPANPLHAATKAYVDTVLGGAGPFLPMSGGTLTGSVSMPSPSSALNPSTGAPPAPGSVFSARYGTQQAVDIFGKVLNVPPRNTFHVLEGVLTVTPAVTSLNNYNAAIGGFCSLQTANGIGFAVGGYAVAEANNAQTGAFGTISADSPNVSGLYTGVKLQHEYDWYCGNAGTQVRGTLHYGYFLKQPNSSINTVGFSTTLNGGANAMITADFNATTMNVTAIAVTTPPAAPLAIGMRLEATGVDGTLNITITALGTGSGGTGTYTISANVGVIASTTVRATSTYLWNMLARSPDGTSYVALDVGQRNAAASLTVGNRSQISWLRYSDLSAATGRVMQMWIEPMLTGGVMFLSNLGGYGNQPASFGVDNYGNAGSSFMARNHAKTAFLDMLHLDVSDRTVVGGGSAVTFLNTSQGNAVEIVDDGVATTNAIAVKGATATLPARVYVPGAGANIQFANNALAANTVGGFVSPWPVTNGVPTGIPAQANATNAFVIYNSTSHTLNIFDPTLNAWVHIPTVAGAA